MSEHGTNIEWTHVPGFKGETWNPTTGCDRVSPGCANCYALDLAAWLKGMGQPAYQRDGDPRTSGPGFGITEHPDRLETPLRWSKPRAVFVNSMSDLFHEGIAPAFIGDVFDVMRRTPQHIYMVLTKRPERMAEVLAMQPLVQMLPLPNVWLGVSIENSRYTYRADILRQIPAAVRFISAEPLLDSLFQDHAPGATRRAPARTVGGSSPTVPPHESRALTDDGVQSGAESPRVKAPLDLTSIDWVIAGGESGGHDVRPMNPEWVRELRDACLDEDYIGPGEVGRVGPAFFFKQWGSWSPGNDEDEPSGEFHGIGSFVEACLCSEGTQRMVYRGPQPKAGGKVLDGRLWCEIPEATQELTLV